MGSRGRRPGRYHHQHARPRVHHDARARQDGRSVRVRDVRRAARRGNPQGARPDRPAQAAQAGTRRPDGRHHLRRHGRPRFRDDGEHQLLHRRAGEAGDRRGEAARRHIRAARRAFTVRPPDLHLDDRHRSRVRRVASARRVGDTPRLGRRDAPARHLERPVRVRPGRARRRLPDPVLRLCRPDRRPGAGQAQDRVADQAMSSRLRAHRPGDTAGHRDARHAARAPDSTALGPRERRQAGREGHGRLSAGRDRTGHAAPAGRARRYLTAGVRVTQAGAPRADARGQARVPEPAPTAAHPPVGTAGPVRVYPAGGVPCAGSAAWLSAGRARAVVPAGNCARSAGARSVGASPACA